MTAQQNNEFRANASLICAFIGLLSAGCASTAEVITDPASRAPSAHIEILADRPAGAHSIAELTYYGGPNNELDATKFFLRRAQALGGSAIYQWQTPGEQALRFQAGRFTTTSKVLFHCNVITYEHGPPRPLGKPGL